MRLRSVGPLIIATASLAALPASARVIYVQGAANGDGSSWSEALPRIQAALDIASSGDEIWVAAGGYPENLTLKSGVALYGGFTDSETDRDSRDWSANPTVIDGGQKAPVARAGADVAQQAAIDGFTLRAGHYSDGGPSATGGGGISASGAKLRIENNTIERNTSNTGVGGGVYLEMGTYEVVSNTIAYNSVPTVGDRFPQSGSGSAIAAAGVTRFENNDVHHNTTATYQDVPGGCISVSGAGLSFAGNRIHDNDGNVGAAGANAVVTRNTITSNTTMFNLIVNGDNARIRENVVAHNKGAGLQVYATNAWIERNAIVDNATHTGRLGPLMIGAGIVCEQAATVRDNLVAQNGSTGIQVKKDAVLVNNTVVDNARGSEHTDYPYTGGIVASGKGVSVTLVNNIVAGNGFGPLRFSAPWSYGVWITAQNTVVAHHNNLYQNLGADAQGLPAGAYTSADPLFVNTSAGDYHLQPGSTLRDAGDDSYVLGGEKDLDGNNRIRGAHVDLGAYEAPVPGDPGLAAAIRALRIAGGLTQATPEDVTGLGGSGGASSLSAVDIRDAVLAIRQR